jgi:glycerophosphoryl diester phosphodiesterase
VKSPSGFHAAPGNPLLVAGQRLVVGHRGNALHAPENTIVSMQQAVAAGADAVEVDVHLTADGEVVVIHDPAVDRTTEGRGSVAAMKLSQVQALDAGFRFSPPGAARPFPHRARGVRIPTLAEALSALPNTPFVIELKTATALARALEVVKELRAEHRTVLASFDLRAVAPLRGTGVATGAARAELSRMFARSMFGMRIGRPDFDAVFLPRRYAGLPLSPLSFVRGSAPWSVPVHVWVENSPAGARALWAAGVCGIVTDDPGSIVRARDST